MTFCRTRHCRECGMTMGLRYCKNPACPESPLYWYHDVVGELWYGQYRAACLAHYLYGSNGGDG